MRALNLALLLFLPSLGCSPAQPEFSDGSSSSIGVTSLPLEDVVSVIRMIAIEERDNVINVAPEVVVDHTGGFLVADSREGQIRHYSDTGTLSWYTGRRGSGPGEFREVQIADRLPDGRIIACDWQSRVSIYSSSGDSLLMTQETRLQNIEDIDVVNDSLIVLAARLASANSPRVHVYNLRSSRVMYSFFEPFSTFSNREAAAVTGFSRLDRRGDTLAVTFGPSDSIYLYLLDGTPLSTIPLASAKFRRIGPGKEGGAQAIDKAWLGTFDIVSDVYWMADGSLVASYQSMRPEAAMSRDWRLLHIRRNGRSTVEVYEAPRLLAVHPGGDTLYFQSAETEVPNLWFAGVLQSVQ